MRSKSGRPDVALVDPVEADEQALTELLEVLLAIEHRMALKAREAASAPVKRRAKMAS